ncbi:hypothetical protein RB213_005040 [Colletotrichum asianum]
MVDEESTRLKVLPSWEPVYAAQMSDDPLFPPTSPQIPIICPPFAKEVNSEQVFDVQNPIFSEDASPQLPQTYPMSD